MAARDPGTSRCGINTVALHRYMASEPSPANPFSKSARSCTVGFSL